MEQLRADLYRIPVPLPQSPLKELNSYLILGRERNLLIDTGFHRPECAQALFSALEQLGAGRENTDVLLTHLHSDHAGLAPAVAGETGTIYVGAKDLPLLENFSQQRSQRWSNMDELYVREGFPRQLLTALKTANPARAYAPPPTSRYQAVAADEVLVREGREIQCLFMPGHTPGQMCFFLEKEGVLFLGDHVLFDITPNIAVWYGVEDSLGDYLDSLRRIRAYDGALCLPGHRGRGELGPRVDALLGHHQKRLEEVLGLVKIHPGRNAYDLAGEMTWRIRAKNWQEFPLTQKWFAVGECISHLDYLHLRGEIRREENPEGQYRYHPV